MTGAVGGNPFWLIKMLNEPAKSTLSEKFRAIHFFPDALLQLISVGESNKSVSEVLQKVADYYAEEIGAVLDALAFVVVPVMILVAGLLLAIMLYVIR